MSSPGSPVGSARPEPADLEPRQRAGIECAGRNPSFSASRASSAPRPRRTAFLRRSPGSSTPCSAISVSIPPMLRIPPGAAAGARRAFGLEAEGSGSRAPRGRGRRRPARCCWVPGFAWSRALYPSTSQLAPGLVNAALKTRQKLPRSGKDWPASDARAIRLEKTSHLSTRLPVGTRARIAFACCHPRVGRRSGSRQRGAKGHEAFHSRDCRACGFRRVRRAGARRLAIKDVTTLKGVRVKSDHRLRPRRRPERNR